MTTELKVTSPEEYAELAQRAAEIDRADPGTLVPLPKTGAVVRLRRTDMEKLAIVGRVPMSLVSAAKGIKEGDGDEEGAAEKKMATPEQIEASEKATAFVRQTVLENCLEPTLGYDEEGVVAFLDAKGKAVARVDKDDFLYMFDWIAGMEGNDGLDSFRNRKERRASASKSRRKGVRGKAESAPEGVPARA